MRLVIDKKELELLLEQKKEYIGNQVTIDTVIAGVSFLLSVMTAQYQKIFGISGEIIKVFFCTIGILYAVKIIWDFYKYRRNKYTHKVLMKKIEDLDMIQHNHSLVIIKESFNDNMKRFLLYYDEKWDCKLFLNYKTQERGDEAAIIANVVKELKLNQKEVKCRYITSKLQEKYSVSHRENRIYNHRLYELQVNRFSEQEMEKDFVVNGKHYYWMSIEEMEKDDNIRNKNLEVVDFVKEYMG